MLFPTFAKFSKNVGKVISMRIVSNIYNSIRVRCACKIASFINYFVNLQGLLRKKKETKQKLISSLVPTHASSTLGK